MFDGVMPLLNTRARIPLCGMISQYNATGPKEGPDHLSQLMGMILVKRITVRGFIIFDGLENAPHAFMGLLEGKNFGKLVVRIGEDGLT